MSSTGKTRGKSTQDDAALLKGAFDPGFTKKVLRFLQHYRLEGLALDWEENLLSLSLFLFKNLSVVLHSNKMKLTLAPSLQCKRSSSSSRPDQSDVLRRRDELN